jgi:hypothetical protein
MVSSRERKSAPGGRLGVAALLVFVAALLAGGCASRSAGGPAGHVFRDCSDCPEMVVVLLKAGAPIDGGATS